MVETHHVDPSPEQKEFFSMAQGFVEYLNRILHLNKKNIRFAIVMVQDNMMATNGNVPPDGLKMLLFEAVKHIIAQDQLAEAVDDAVGLDTTH